MKSTIKLFTLAFVALFAVSCNNNDEYDMLNSLWRNVTQNEARIDDLEKWCSQANTNITSLQTIVNVIESNDVVTSVTPIMEGGVEIGYTITFADHDPITIYHGKDGKDGANGADGANGQDGASPIVGVAKDTDGVYYWTLNGEWLLDADGNKLRVSGQDGADGNDGQNGQDGQNGSNGQDGVTPQLKIEADYWWISYDNGNTWTQLGKAKGDKGDTGATGAAGADGQDGDSMFQRVTQDAANVYFTLADGTLITIAKGGGGADDGGYVFTITYMPNGGEGEVVIDTVYYANAYTLRNTALFSKSGFYIAMWNTKPDGTGVDFSGARELISITRNITFYAKWAQEGVPYAVDLGLSVKWATCNVGASTPEGYGNYYAWGETTTKSTYDWSTYKWCNGSYKTLTKYCTSSTYGTVDNKTVLELADDAARVNWGGAWRMPTDAEWTELRENCEWTLTSDYNGTGVKGRVVTSKTNGNHIFLPAAGYRS
ncbi:MAG: hypothetical protein IJW01_05635, partial [Paludibacteraceae bacterium]|nr:hypothetical protein [Paludibacteraceae bacterium]